MDYSYTAARGMLLWLMFLNPGAIVAGIAGWSAVTFGAQFFLSEDKSVKDAQQDARMDATDARALREDADRAERRAEIRARLDLHDSELRDLNDTIHQIYGWGAGAFGAITVLQIAGIIRKRKEE